MKHLFILALLWPFISNSVFSQRKNPVDSVLYQHIAVLSSDSLEGRLTGTKGSKIAAKYISDFFIKHELNNSSLRNNYQLFPLFKSQWGDVYIKQENRLISNFDNMAFTGHAPINDEVKKQIVFVGEGDDETLYKFDLNDKVVIVAVNNIRSTHALSKKIQRRGAFAVFYFNPNNSLQFESYQSTMKDHILKQRITINKIDNTQSSRSFIFDNKEIARLLNVPVSKLKRISKGNHYENVPPSQISLKCVQVNEELEAQNIVGIFEANDTKDAIVISAHYDHLGIVGDEIYNGADDNTSGVSAVLYIAEKIKNEIDASKVNKNIIFLLTDAEESGLLGSKSFVASSFLSQYNIVKNINLDMIGRVDNKHKKNKPYIYVIGLDKYPEFIAPINLAVSQSDIDVDLSLNNSMAIGLYYYRSDQLSFHNAGIPAIFLFGGTHEQYHTPEDDVNRINFHQLQKRSDFIYSLVKTIVYE